MTHETLFHFIVTKHWPNYIIGHSDTEGGFFLTREMLIRNFALMGEL